jgi:hypothetical protein
MRFLMYWHESIKFLRWPEFKELLLDSIRTFGKSLILITKFFWWLVILGIGSTYFSKFLLSIKQSFWANIFDILVKNFYYLDGIIALIRFVFLIVYFFCVCFPYFCFPSIVIFVMYLTTRQTTEPKNFSYYLKHLNSLWLIFATLMSTILILVSITLILKHYKLNHNINVLCLILTPYFLSVDMGIFFFFDSNRKFIASIKKGFSFVFYFFPLCIVFQTPIIISWVFRIFLNQQHILKLYPFLNSSFIATSESFLSYILCLVSLSASATLYVKIKDKYPELFVTSQMPSPKLHYGLFERFHNLVTNLIR